MIARRGAIVLLALAAASAPAAPAALPAPLALTGPGPYYRLPLPLALQSAAPRADLGDLRVRNAHGETMAFAWLPEPEPVAPAEELAAAIYEVPAPPPAASAGAPAPPRTWIVDTHAAGFALERLALALAPGSQGVFTLGVDAGDDLQRWQPVQAAVQVVRLERTGEVLGATDVDLADVQARYLRLSTRAGAAAPELAGATITRHRPLPPAGALQWSDAVAPSACDAQGCDYPMPRNAAIEQIEVMLAEPQTVGRLAVSAHAQASTVASIRRPHLLHGALRALREKERAEVDDRRGMLLLATENVYRLRDEGAAGELRAPPIRLDGGRWSVLRLTSAGPVDLLHPTPPTLRVGTRPRTLVFLARGPAPFRLESAPVEDTAGAMTLAELMPARAAGDPPPPDVARVVAPLPGAVSHAASPGSSAPAAAASNAPWLWIALLAGLALMGAMAWSLLKRPAPPP